VIAAVERLAIFPTSGRPLPEFPTSPLREVIVDPYRIVYRTSGSAILILAVIHGKRLLKEEVLS
jgi:Plasmid stabilization system protein